MPAVIRLMRAGAKKRPFYRMVVADSRRQRDGRFVEILGHYDPIAKPYTLVIQKERAEEWIGKGAVPSEQAASLLRQLGVKLVNASKPTKTAATAAKPRTRLKPRPVTERKARNKVARAKARAKKSATATATA